MTYQTTIQKSKDQRWSKRELIVTDSASGRRVVVGIEGDDVRQAYKVACSNFRLLNQGVQPMTASAIASLVKQREGLSKTDFRRGLIEHFISSKKGAKASFFVSICGA
jgi:hypothetical protein